jgi:tRNA nucleotidyltransferase (CCA-adding enzyme)
MDFNNVLKDVLSEIKPSSEENSYALSVVDFFVKKLNDNIRKKKIDAKVVLGGSFAKGVWISGDYDVDIFVKFSLKYKKKDLGDLLESLLFAWDFERVHGSRDYFLIFVDKIKFEIVPVLDILKLSEAENVTDISPFHVDWVNKFGKGLKDDILLLKSFCKAQNVYGAESYIKGFSGHVVDIFVIHFNGLLNFFKAVSSWKTDKKIFIDPSGKCKGDPLFFLNKSKISGPLILLDPIQQDRNAAAALSLEKLRLFISSVKSFLKKPSVDFFKIKIIDVKKLNDDSFVVLKVFPVIGKVDIVGCKILQVFDFLKRELDKEGFVINSSDWRWDKKNFALFWFKPKDIILPDFKVHKGPPVSRKSDVVLFKKKYKKTFVKDGFVFAEVKRNFSSFSSFLKYLIKSDYVKERALKVIFL